MLLTLLKKLIHPKNWLVTLFFLANGALATVLFKVLFVEFAPDVLDDVYVILIGVAIYLLCVAICMSAFGEWFFRKFFCPKTILAEEHVEGERLIKLFNEVYEKAKEKRQSIPNGVRLYVCQDDSINACALGKTTIILNQGALKLSDEELKGILAHEFAHLGNADALFALAITGGNFMFAIVVTVFKMICLIIERILCAIFRRENTIIGLILLFIINLFVWLWTKIGNLIISLNSRKAEYAADNFAGEIGYAKELKTALLNIERENGGFRMGVIEALNSSHPKTEKRVERLKENFNV